MANNKFNDDEFIKELAELVQLRAEQQPEKAQELREKYPKGSSKDLTKEEWTNKMIDILETLGIIPPEQDPEQKGESCDE